MKPLSITTKRMLRRAVAAFCACACVFAVSACGADETGKIRIGIKFDQPGLGFKKNGTYVGFDVDVAKYVAKKLGYSEDEIVWKESPSKQREAMLQNGDVDYIVASYSITDERKKVVVFGPKSTCPSLPMVATQARLLLMKSFISSVSFAMISSLSMVGWPAACNIERRRTVISMIRRRCCRHALFHQTRNVIANTKSRHC